MLADFGDLVFKGFIKGILRLVIEQPLVGIPLLLVAAVIVYLIVARGWRTLTTAKAAAPPGSARPCLDAKCGHVNPPEARVCARCGYPTQLPE